MQRTTAAYVTTPGRSRARGFTLIELMIVVALVAILAMIAYPAYQDHIQKTRRADGKALLLDAAARMERHYFDENAYTDDLTELGFAAADNASSPEGYWQLTVDPGPTGSLNTSFLLIANDAPGFDDAECTSLRLNSRGEKDATGSADAATCWR